MNKQYTAEAIIEMVNQLDALIDDRIIDVKYDDIGRVKRVVSPFVDVASEYSYITINGTSMVSSVVSDIGTWRYAYNSVGDLSVVMTPWSVSNDTDETNIFIKESLEILSDITLTPIGVIPIPTNAALAYPNLTASDVKVFMGEDYDEYNDTRHIVELVNEEGQFGLLVYKVSDADMLIRRTF